MKKPKQLMIEYEDGTTEIIPFSQLGRSVWLELSRRGFCSSPSAAEPTKSYLLLRWKNGWQEVVGLDEDSVDLLRYYILERVEETGRVVLETGADFPLLFTIKRLPKELESLSIFGSEPTKAYQVAPKEQKEEGGKIEHVEFDQAERHFEPHPEGTGKDAVQEVPRLLATEITKKNLSPQEVLALEPGQKAAQFKDLAKAMGVRAMERQEDLYGFFQFLIGKLAASG